MINFFKKTIIFIFAFSFLLPASSAKGFEEKDFLGFLNNKPFQDLLEKPFYLVGENKDEAIPFYLKDFVNWDYKIAYDKNYFSEIENPFYDYEKSLGAVISLELTQPYKEKLRYRKTSTVYIKEDETKEFLELVSEEIDKDPVNARFEITSAGNLKILEKNQDGKSLLIEESFQTIKSTLINNKKISYIPLRIKKIPAEISSSQPEKYPIKELIGTGKSDFSGSTPTRIHNIKTGAKRFHGLIIKPQEEFSFTTLLGAVDESTGYKEELVIKKNQTVPEYGGGICQVSTTMFRAALNSGMKITERHNHSFPVHYYNPPGTDATIYIPKPDLKFKNDSNDYLLIQTRMDEQDKKFYIDFYSRKDLRDVELIGPEIVERTDDGKLRTTLKQIVKDKEGNEIFQDVFKSFYDNPENYPSPDEIILDKPKDWSGRQWDEYYAKFGAIIEEMKKGD